MQPVNVHATALVVDGRGILIFGASGTGKSSLALQLIDNARLAGRAAFLVADDRVWLVQRNGRLVAEAPEAIAGLVEIRGFGPAPVQHEGAAVIDAAIWLVEPDAAPRHRAGETHALQGIALPRLDVAAGNPVQGARAVAAWLPTL